MVSERDRSKRDRRIEFTSRRRHFLAGVASTGAAGLAGCLGSDDDENGDDNGEENGDNGEENGDNGEEEPEPMTLEVGDTTEYSASLSWEPSEADVDRYNVYVDPGEKMHPWQEDSSYLWTRTEEPGADVHGLNSGTEYEFLVTAEVDGEESESTNVVSETTDGDAPEYQGPPTYEPTGNPQYGKWTHTLIGAGGKTTGIETTPANPNVVYLKTDVSGTYRSDNKGENWYMIREGYAARGLAVDPRDENRVVIAENDGLYYSEQVGANYGDDELTVDDVWDHALDVGFPGANGTYREFGDVLARNPENPDELLATANDGFYRSTDGGASWESIDGAPENVHPTHVRYDPDASDTIYVCSQAEGDAQAGVYRSTDGGDSWEQRHADADTTPIEIGFDPSTDAIYGLVGHDGNAGNSELYRSTDGGATWESFANGLATDGELASLQVNPHDDHVYVNTGDDAGSNFIFRLEAGGDEWERHAPVTSEDLDGSHWWDALDQGSGSAGFDGVAEIAFDQEDPQKWYLSATYAVYTSPDAGQRWRYASKGIEEMVGMSAVGDPDPDSDIVHTGIADMQYFQLQDNGDRMAFRKSPDIHNTMRVEVSPDNPDRVYTSSACYNFWPEVGRLCISDDRGESWTSVDAEEAGLPAVEFESGQTWYETGYGPDSGSNPVTPVIGGIAADPNDADHVAIAITGNYGLYDAENDANSWWGGYPEEVMNERDDDEAVGVWRSTDGGQTFEEVPGQLDGHLWENFWVEGNHLAMSGDGTMVIAPMIKGPVQYWDPDEEDWFEADIPASGNAWDVAADPNTEGRFMVPLVDQEGGVFETTDGGETWEELVSHKANGVTYHPNDPDKMAITSSSAPTIYSDDAGETWYELGRGMSGGGNHVTFSGDRLVVGAGGSSYMFVDLDSDDFEVYDPDGGDDDDDGDDGEEDELPDGMYVYEDFDFQDEFSAGPHEVPLDTGAPGIEQWELNNVWLAWSGFEHGDLWRAGHPTSGGIWKAANLAESFQEGTVWFSFLLQGAGDEAGEHAEVVFTDVGHNAHADNPDHVRFGHGAGVTADHAGDWALSVAHAAGDWIEAEEIVVEDTTGVEYQVENPIFAVLKLDLDANEVQMWVDPDETASDPGSADAAISYDGEESLGFDYVQIRNIGLDVLYAGESYADVTPTENPIE